jgi:hypothetical protein
MTGTTVDPIAIVDGLDAETIRLHLAELERQSRALRVLLRAAVARERHCGLKGQYSQFTGATNSQSCPLSKEGVDA